MALDGSSPFTGRPGSSRQLLELAESFDRVLELVNHEAADTVLDAVTQVAVAQLPGAGWASITLVTGERFRTAAATDDLARRADHLQYQLQSGPCLDAARKHTVAHIPDTGQDTRWPEFARRAADECGIGSVLSYRLTLEEPDGTTGSLNLYGRRPDGFDEQQLDVGGLIATAGALAVTAARYRDNAVSLARGLRTNREIGTAVGILMHQHKVTQDQAFDLLRIASQHQNRKLRDIAAEVTHTGTLDLPVPGVTHG
ncbi:GAF and ANTAR domain-containing protein [Cryptosporangium japonicum]|uniref:GAF and ANTAR domain-containing protein n=1 Tax=Cryptosporangium japonicum TaxID=80872 RepID=A0ABP3EPR4_9ACTN